MQVKHYSNAHSDFRIYFRERERSLSDTMSGHKLKALEIVLKPNSSQPLSHPEL